MKYWQKVWLYLVIILASIHYLRDTLQDLGIPGFLTSTLVKAGHSMIFAANPLPYKIYWAVFNTYAIAAVEITLAIICLHRNKFGRLGNATMVIGIGTFCVWLCSWFFLK